MWTTSEILTSDVALLCLLLEKDGDTSLFARKYGPTTNLWRQNLRRLVKCISICQCHPLLLFLNIFLCVFFFMLFSLSRTDEETLNNGVWIHFYFFFANASQVHHQMLKATFSWRHLVMDLCHYHPFHQTTSTQRKYDSVHRKCVGWLEVVDRCWRVHCFTRLFQLSARIKKSGLSWDHLSCRVRSSCSRGAPSVWAARHARSRIPSRLWHWSSSWPDFNISEGEHACHIVLGHRPYAIGGDWGFPLPKSSPKM